MKRKKRDKNKIIIGILVVALLIASVGVWLDYQDGGPATEDNEEFYESNTDYASTTVDIVDGEYQDNSDNGVGE